MRGRLVGWWGLAGTGGLESGKTKLGPTGRIWGSSIFNFILKTTPLSLPDRTQRRPQVRPEVQSKNRLPEGVNVMFKGSDSPALIGPPVSLLGHIEAKAVLDLPRCHVFF